MIVELMGPADKMSTVIAERDAKIKRLTTALKLAREYVKKVEAILPMRPNVVTPDLDSINAALNAE